MLSENSAEGLRRSKPISKYRAMKCKARPKIPMIAINIKVDPILKKEEQNKR